jgi:hypothetical protein
MSGKYEKEFNSRALAGKIAKLVVDAEYAEKLMIMELAVAGRYDLLRLNKGAIRQWFKKTYEEKGK